ncbi:MAG: citramalate synthase [Pseudomonadota bacterium]
MTLLEQPELNQSGAADLRERLYVFDTTLRDGQQTQGVDFSVKDKIRIAQALDDLGVDYIEGGWPGANPTDSEFFSKAPKTRARLLAFGMTKRSGRSAANDEILAEVINAGTASVCLVGKAHDFHVTEALGISVQDNLTNIRESFQELSKQGREAIFDAEHFFDGYKANPSYARACLEAALEGGARWVVLCDTNGGSLPGEIGDVVDALCQVIPGGQLGIHTHNDTENAVAGSLSAIEAGARQVQGTLNGLGERCGNANLTSLIPTLVLKTRYNSVLETGIDAPALPKLRAASLMLDEVLNRVSDRQAPYVGSAAFAHKSGLHASAILKDPRTYEHVEPSSVGNERVIPMSNQAGRSNLIQRLAKAGIMVDKTDKRLSGLLQLVKEREDNGFAYDAAGASFELLARRSLGLLHRFFEVERYRVSAERRETVDGVAMTVSEAVVVLHVDGERMISASESQDPITKSDQGPVNALSRALLKDLGRYQNTVDRLKLVDFKVRILNGGTEAVTRVMIDSSDGQGVFSTVGVSPNIVDASFQALEDAVVTCLLRAGAQANPS